MLWERLETIVKIESPWVRLVAERWRDETGRLLDYWRAERPHSLIVPAVQGGRLLVPKPMFRPGVGRATLDLVGGRLPVGQTPVEAAPELLQRELGLPPGAVRSLRPINPAGWIINSSFENQMLFGVLAEIDEAATPDPQLLDRAVPFDLNGIAALGRELECLQCRAVLHELLLAMALKDH